MPFTLSALLTPETVSCAHYFNTNYFNTLIHRGPTYFNPKLFTVYSLRNENGMAEPAPATSSVSSSIQRTV